MWSGIDTALLTVNEGRTTFSQHVMYCGTNQSHPSSAATRPRWRQMGQSINGLVQSKTCGICRYDQCYNSRVFGIRTKREAPVSTLSYADCVWLQCLRHYTPSEKLTKRVPTIVCKKLGLSAAGVKFSLWNMTLACHNSLSSAPVFFAAHSTSNARFLTLSPISLSKVPVIVTLWKCNRIMIYFKYKCISNLKINIKSSQNTVLPHSSMMEHVAVCMSRKFKSIVTWPITWPVIQQLSTAGRRNQVIAVRLYLITMSEWLAVDPYDLCEGLEKVPVHFEDKRLIETAKEFKVWDDTRYCVYVITLIILPAYTEKSLFLIHKLVICNYETSVVNLQIWNMCFRHTNLWITAKFPEWNKFIQTPL